MEERKFDFSKYSYVDLLDLLSTSTHDDFFDLSFDFDADATGQKKTYEVVFLDYGQVVLRPLDTSKSTGRTTTKIDEKRINAYSIYLFYRRLARLKERRDLERVVRLVLMTSLRESLKDNVGKVSVVSLVRLGLINDFVVRHKEFKEFFVYLGDKMTQNMEIEMRGYFKEMLEILFNDPKIKLNYETFNKLKEKENEKIDEYKKSIYCC